MNHFTYCGQNSAGFGILIDDAGTTFDAPDRDYSKEEIPGRNGDLTIDNGRWKNADVTYSCGIGVDFDNNFSAFRSFLASCTGYGRLEDSYHPDEFRLARVKEGIRPDVFMNGKAGTFDVVFDCKPQRFLKTGETDVAFTSSGSIVNPTRYDARPMLRVYGTGSFTVGGTTMVITSANSYTDIDCDIEDCFKGATNCNGNVQLSSGGFPVLKPGNNGVTFLGSITRIIITPRWWSL